MPIVFLLRRILAAENEFPGLYGPDLSKECILEDDRTLLVNSIWHSRLVVLRIDLETGTVVNDTTDENFGAWTASSRNDFDMILQKKFRS